MRFAADLEALLLIVRSHKALKIAELGDELGASASRTSKIVRRLSDDGLAKCGFSKDDRRVRLVSPTPKGRDRIAKMALGGRAAP